ncbi:hypothetical protein I7I48_07467 [Histoplasma ohiense]|nr:hypothetical protein I7I48_07467 [Histoplasma ohiense (nom. inval.)]
MVALVHGVVRISDSKDIRGSCQCNIWALITWVNSILFQLQSACKVLNNIRIFCLPRLFLPNPQKTLR